MGSEEVSEFLNELWLHIGVCSTFIARHTFTVLAALSHAIKSTLLIINEIIWSYKIRRFKELLGFFNDRIGVSGELFPVDQHDLFRGEPLEQSYHVVVVDALLYDGHVLVDLAPRC